MAFSESEITTHTKAFEKFKEKYGPPLHMRGQRDWGCRIDGQSIELYESRPLKDKPLVFNHTPFAKATFMTSNSMWKIFYREVNGKWHSYGPKEQVRNLKEFFKLIIDDDDGCFTWSTDIPIE
jgi:hypothetical protein